MTGSIATNRGARRGGQAADRAVICGLLAGWLALAVVACGDEVPPPRATDLASIRVELTDTSALGEAPYDFVSQYTPVTLRVEAHQFDGQIKSDYQGTLQVRIVPGEIDPATRYVDLTDGVNPAHQVRLRYIFGEARIWVEEVGLDSLDSCHDGFDNDGDGRIDYPGDPGCSGPDDPSEGTATYITGLSDPLVFENVAIRDVQYNAEDPRGESPLLGQEVRLERGTLIVTNVVLDGFYLTDADETNGYQSIYVFNYSYPEGVRIGDKMAWVSGGVDEFQSDTQLTFPNWSHDSDYVVLDADRAAMSLCQPVDNPNIVEVEPIALTGATISDLTAMEAAESSLVRVEDAQISTRFVHCDFDFSGAINGREEEDCRSECQNDLLCTEWSNYLQRDQFNIVVDGAQAQISKAYIVAGFDPTEGCTLGDASAGIVCPLETPENREQRCHEVSLDPLAIECPERTLASATGSLRHVYLTSRIQLWEIAPRYACDIQFACTQDSDCPNEGTCGENLICEYPIACGDNSDCPNEGTCSEDFICEYE